MVLGLNYVIVVWFVYSCYPGSASLTHLHALMKEGCIHMAIHCIERCLNTLYTYKMEFQFEGVLGLNYVIVVWFVLSCYPGSARSTHLHGFDGPEIHPYNYSLLQKVLTHIIHI